MRGEAERREEAHRDRWESARFVAWVCAQPYDSKKSLREPADLIRFGWEGLSEAAKAVQSIDMERFKAKAAAFFNSDKKTSKR